MRVRFLPRKRPTLRQVLIAEVTRNGANPEYADVLIRAAQVAGINVDQRVDESEWAPVFLAELRRARGQRGVI